MRISDWSSDVCSSDLDAARRAEDGKLFLQPLGRVERAAGVPEGRVGALGRLVVKDEEIADIDIFAQRLAIVAVALGVAEGAGREQRHQPRDARLDEMDRGRFERLEKTTDKPQRDDILIPRERKNTRMSSSHQYAP